MCEKALPISSISQRRARRQGAGLEARVDPLAQRRPVVSLVSERAMKRPTARLGMMLAAEPPSSHDAVDEVARSKLLTREADRHLSDRHGVEGVDADPRRGRRVGLLAVEGDVEMIDRETMRVESLDGQGVHHHRGVHVVEVAGVDEVDLAAAALLRGRAEQDDGEVELVGDGGQTDGGAERRRGDDVVAARVTRRRAARHTRRRTPRADRRYPSWRERPWAVRRCRARRESRPVSAAAATASELRNSS